MGKNNKTTKIVISVSEENEAEVLVESEKPKKKEVDVEERIYNVLNTVEKIAVKAAQIHQILKKSAKKKKRRTKSLARSTKRQAL